jgi:tetratricopeptide (TPR) repeat protein
MPAIGTLTTWSAIGVVVAALLLPASPSRAAGTNTNADETGAGLVRALAVTERRAGPAAPELLPILASLAQLRFEHADLADATALRRRSFKIAVAAYGSASVPAAKAMAALARLYIELRRYLDAEPLALAAASAFRARGGEGDPALAPVLADEARIALARGEPARARNFAQAAIAIDKRNHLPPSSDGFRVLGAALAAEDRFSDSERALREALALDRAKGDRLASARSLAQLGNLYLRQKRFAEALPPIEEATLIDQEHLGATHPLIAEDFHDLGLVYLGTNRPADAAKALQTAIDLLERGAGGDTPTLAYVEIDLAHAEHALGHDEKAQSLFQAARHILNAAEDEEHRRQRQA